MMAPQHRQEALSLAYVTAVAARAGMTFSLPSHDYGTDLWLHQVIETSGERRQTGQGFRIQLKSTTIATLEHDAVVYDLDLRAYEMLRVGDDLYPLLLLVYVMPANEAEWLVQDETRLELRSCSYWMLLQGQPQTTNTTSVRIRIPRTNQFTSGALVRIMDLIRRNKESK